MTAVVRLPGVDRRISAGLLEVVIGSILTAPNFINNGLAIESMRAMNAVIEREASSFT